MLDNIPHIKLIGGVIIVKKDSAEKVIDFLRGFDVEFNIRDVKLLHEDEVMLDKFHPI